ncbi:PAS domain S-box protein [Methanoregula sp.]|uniref:PAS domain S-box protein n=1 Tax=Methanoregula sp. TaxID=2052170 RepID=UPI002BC8B0C6|nr:PAS domain S-box protein [Methanoregula sp.]HVP96926.1 PAS domain S-box protein [Methanoregula sp.]
MYRILYVDDESSLLEIGKIFLERNGQFSVDIINSAPEALAFLATKNYDAIISDYQMPVMNGIEFLKQIRSSGNSIPFIIFTGRGREEVVIEAINSGADFYLQKGGDPNSQFAELSHKLKIAVERKRAVNALVQDEIRLKTLGTFYQMISAPLKELMIFAVEKSVEITLSSIGYLAFVSEDESLLTMYAWSSVAMKECHIEKKPIEYPLHATGLWGEAVRQRRPVITNDYAAYNPLKKGYPKGHVPVIRHMNIPVFDGSRIVMVAGVGNKPSDYDERDVYELSILMSGLWNVIKQRRAEEELRKKNDELNASYEKTAAAEEELRSNLDDLIQREHALKASEERYRNVVETQTEFISRFQPDSTHVFVNEAYSRYFGMKSDEIIGHRFRPNIPVEDQERVKLFFASLTKDHPVDVIEHRIIMPDGSIRWQQWTDRAIFDSSGKVTEYQSVGQDITLRKLEEQVLHENEQRLTSIYNTVGDSIFQLTVEPHEQYRFTSVNSAFSRTTGIPSGQVIGKKVNEIIPEPSLSLVLGKYRQAIEEKAIVRWEEISHYPSGQLTGEVSIAPIFDQAGNCLYLIGSVHDITERKHAEEELRERNSQMRALIDNLPFDTWAMDRSGHYILQNQVSIKNWGDSVGKTPKQIHLRKDLLERWQENNRKAFEGTVVKGELSVPSENGVRIYDEIIAPVRVGNVINGIIGVNIDITEQKRADEAQLLATKKLKLLTSITRHDINNQILALKAYLALMEMNRFDPAFDEYFRKTKITAERMSAMIRFTNEYESIGMKTPGWENARALVDTAASQVPLVGIRLENNIPAGTELYADPLIVKVFYNLMDNAVRYGETITTIRFSLQKSGTDLVILCEDDGNGIPADEKEKIFDRGFGKNTGLGLFLSREILSITGIKIQETGKPGKGARFEMMVPKGTFRLPDTR